MIQLEKKQVLSLKCSRFLTEPRTLEGLQSWQFSKALIDENEMGRLEIPKGIALAQGGVLTDRLELNSTYLAMPDGKKPREHEVFEASFSRFFPKIAASDVPVISLSSHWHNAFYHWLHEVLPQLGLLEKGDLTGAHFFVATKLPFQKQSLDLLGIKPQNRISATQFDAVKAPAIITLSTPQMPTPSTVAFLRSQFLPHLKKSKAKKRLYLSRGDADRRRVINETEVTQILEQYGFEKAMTANLDLLDQMELFYNAEMVVAPHGAGLSHLAFCDPGTPVLELFSPAYINTCYWHLSSAASLNYSYLLGEGKRYPDYVDPGIDPDMIIDPKKVARALQTF